MDRSTAEARGVPHRREVLAGIGVAIGSAIAGCSAPSEDGTPTARARIEALEAQLAEARAENEALENRIDELEGNAATYQRRLDNANLWGFDPETMDRLQRVADEWSDSVVVIDAVTEDGIWSTGTGWMYADGVIVTNAHVVRPQRLPEDQPVFRYLVWDRSGDTTEGSLAGYTFGQDEVFERQEDIGFLSVPDSMTAGRQLPRGVSRELAADEPLVQIGHPYSLPAWTPSVGPFVAHREPFFATNVPGQPGVSGSPVLDVSGEVIGMTWGGEYVQIQSRQPGDAPVPGQGRALFTFEHAINGKHSYMHRIQTAADALL